MQVGSQLGYRTAITTETATAQDVKFLETGTRLIFRPYIGDNGYIRLEIHPEDSSGSVDSQGLPSKFVTQVTTNIMVKDGHTIVIGGLFRESTTRSRTQVPFLGSLPGVGPLFRKQTDQTIREEDIILLTPHIVKDDAAYSEFSEQELKQTERIRVGMRKGLMPWGRERLAESWYQNAVNEMNKPHPDRNKALFHLNCAIHLNPKFTEAMEMRAQTHRHGSDGDRQQHDPLLREEADHGRAEPTARRRCRRFRSSSRSNRRRQGREDPTAKQAAAGQQSSDDAADDGQPTEPPTTQPADAKLVEDNSEKAKARPGEALGSRHRAGHR